MDELIVEQAKWAEDMRMNDDGHGEQHAAQAELQADWRG